MNLVIYIYSKLLIIKIVMMFNFIVKKDLKIKQIDAFEENINYPLYSPTQAKF